MNADRLLALFEQISEAPDAIPRLRRFILDLAVRGKLVEQDPEDEPAETLLEKIAAQKTRLEKLGEIKKQKPLQPTNDGELAKVLPSGWSSSYLGNITACLDYMRIPVNGTERKLRIEGKCTEQLFPYFGATQQQGWIDDYLFDDELVLLGEDGVPFSEPLRQKAYLISGKTWVNNHAHVFKPILVSSDYLVYCLNVFDYKGRVVGATRSKLNQAQAVAIPIPLPPLAEQHRIVAKVDELMALCDQLEQQLSQAEQSRRGLLETVLREALVGRLPERPEGRHAAIA
jgi:type I restriction enzyme S subunit